MGYSLLGIMRVWMQKGLMCPENLDSLNLFLHPEYCLKKKLYGTYIDAVLLSRRLYRHVQAARPKGKSLFTKPIIKSFYRKGTFSFWHSARASAATPEAKDNLHQARLYIRHTVH